MTNHNGSTKTGDRSMARSVGDLAGDAMTLADLQLRLLKLEAQNGLKRVVIGAVMLAAALVMLLGVIPVLLILIAECLLAFTSLDRPASFGIAVGAGILLAGLVGITGWLSFRKCLSLFERSAGEFSKNLRWFKEVLSGAESHPHPLPTRDRTREGIL